MKQDLKRRAIHRLKIAEGQIRGLEKAVQGETYCIDVINQSHAVREALMSFEKLMLENHLSTHVVEQVKSGNIKKAVKEVLSIHQFSQRSI